VRAPHGDRPNGHHRVTPRRWQDERHAADPSHRNRHRDRSRGRHRHVLPASSGGLPKASAADWARADALDPGAVTPDGQWLLRFRCFAIRLDSGETVLVDAGIGPAGSPAAAWAPVPGRLPEELAAVDIDREAVSAVVLTHLHTDHIGWAVVGDGEAARPYFPNARYVLQRAEVAALDSPALAERLLDPLRATDQLHLVDGTTRLGRGVLAVHTPGHTPGHQCVLVESGDERLAVIGDLLVHALQLVDPDQPYAFEVDPDEARESRLRLLGELARVGGAIATAHLTDAFRAV